MVEMGKTAGLVRFSRARREENLLRLYEAGERLMEEHGYLAVTIDDIARAAGVSRQTFYRHFDGKYAIAVDIFERNREEGGVAWSALGAHVGDGLAGIERWVQDIVDRSGRKPGLLRAFVEMGVAEPAFLLHVRQLAPALLEQLTQSMPVVARLWQPAEHRAIALLRIGQLLDLCNAQATGILSMPVHYAIARVARDFHEILREEA